MDDGTFMVPEDSDPYSALQYHSDGKEKGHGPSSTTTLRVPWLFTMVTITHYEIVPHPDHPGDY
jgi:hypothetical protein